jgi:hypothetical protein
MQVTINGKPLAASWKQMALVMALSLGGFTVGASYPEMNPLDLIGEQCAQ